MDVFTFEMGEHTAEFPRGRQYVANHMWATQCAEYARRYRFGLTAYAVRLLQDVYFLDWVVQAGTPIGHRAVMGSIESKKAESELYSPVAGTLTTINEDLLDDPSTINADTYGDGWMFEIEADDIGPLLSAEQYAEHLIAAWAVAQRTIKGQANK
ncbi:MAG: glycine cleavage system protein H [Planctomycetota bacterium]